ncbi:MAG: ComEC/Rec2 family competence protein, partial [Bacteroidaceae bacterium]|nr:ComEC/Rec2 family competence protein [Bacteroidaceae bacterium]
VVMCMLMELGRVSGGKALSLNTWGVAGFLMLLYNPFYLFDVGFQL